MIEGVVNASREAVIPLTVLGRAGRAMDIEAIVDTGFTGFLTLPSASVAELRLPFEGVGETTLGDGTLIMFPTYAAEVLLDGRPAHCIVDAAETTPLAGMALLDDHDLHIEVAIGGRVVVEAR